MILDLHCQFSSAQVVSDTPVLSTNVLDTKQAVPDIGTGEELYVVVQADTLVSDSSGTTAVVTVNLVTDADSALGSVNADVQALCTFSHGDVAGTTKIARIKPGFPVERYMGIQYVTVNGPLATTCTFSAFVTKNVDKWKSYPKATNAVIND